MATLAVIVAVLSFTVSLVTAWLTLFRRGTVRMTQPTVIFFGSETPRRPGEPARLKVYLRTLLFATAKRGCVIESMHVAFSHDGALHDFDIWVYGERLKLVRGSGLFVGEWGIAANHHFLMPPDAAPFDFTAGRCRLDVFARLLGDDQAKHLFSQELTISREVAASLAEPGTGVYFDWRPSSARYLPHLDKWETPPE